MAAASRPAESSASIKADRDQLLAENKKLGEELSYCRTMIAKHKETSEKLAKECNCNHLNDLHQQVLVGFGHQYKTFQCVFAKKTIETNRHQERLDKIGKLLGDLKSIRARSKEERTGTRKQAEAARAEAQTALKKSPKDLGKTENNLRSMSDSRDDLFATVWEKFDEESKLVAEALEIAKSPYEMRKRLAESEQRCRLLKLGFSTTLILWQRCSSTLGFLADERADTLMNLPLETESDVDAFQTQRTSQTLRQCIDLRSTEHGITDEAARGLIVAYFAHCGLDHRPDWADEEEWVKLSYYLSEPTASPVAKTPTDTEDTYHGPSDKMISAFRKAYMVRLENEESFIRLGYLPETKTIKRLSSVSHEELAFDRISRRNEHDRMKASRERKERRQ